jgi:FixJ family two-component response regulator
VGRAVQRVLVDGGYRVRLFPAARAYLAEHNELEPGCVVIDIKMPDLDGIAMLREARAAGMDAPAVFVTGSDDLEAAVQAMKLGAVDLLEKPVDGEQLLAVVGNAARNGQERLAERRQIAELWRALEHLTPREAEVGALVTSGRLNKQIAVIIGTTEKTVKVHRARAMSKLGAHSVAELVRIVDYLLGDELPTTITTEEHRVVTRPAVLEVMATAVGRGDTRGHHSEWKYSRTLHSTMR